MNKFYDCLKIIVQNQSMHGFLKIKLNKCTKLD